MRRALICLLVALTASVTWSVAAPPAFAAGETWTARNTPTSTWSSVAFGNATYVAVANGGADRVMTSPDGITWTYRTAAATNPWTSVVWGGGADNIFVAVASDGTNRAMTSPDGVTWTARSTPAGAWRSVTYDGLQFVAVASSDSERVMTSPDGVTWTAQADPDAASSGWTSVTYNADDDLLVAVASSGTTRVMTSDNGTAWTPQNDADASNGNWTSVVWGGGVDDIFVAVASGGTNRVMTSDNGTAWTPQTDSDVAGRVWTSVTYDGTQFVATSSGGTDRVVTSPDGVAWTLSGDATDTGRGAWTSVIWAGGKFVAVASSGTSQVMTSANGTAWTVRDAAAQAWVSVAYGNGLFVAVADATTDNAVMTSPDGITWTARAVPESNAWTSVTFGNGRFVAVASDGPNQVMSSPDGITWTAEIAPAPARAWKSVTFAESKFVAVADSAPGADQVMTSADGETWVNSGDPSTGDGAWSAVTWGGGTFVAVGLGELMTSPNGTVWTTNADGDVAAHAWKSVTFGGGQFVAVSSDGTDRVITSVDDGATWAPSGDPTTTDDGIWTSVTFGSSTFVAVADSGPTSWVMNSTNGSAWTAQTAAEENAWQSVTFGAGMFVAVATDGSHRIMTSGAVTQAPTITSFDPVQGPVGTTVTITGTNFTGASSVTFDGVAATDFTVVSPTQITVVVPDGATTGVIRVFTPGGDATSADNYTVTATAASARLFGTDELDTAIAISQEAFPSGAASAVVLARNDFFADALTGGPLAATVDGPMLLTYGAPTGQGGTLPARVADEIDRLIDPGQVVYILGGSLAVSQGVENSLEADGYLVTRLAGADQFGTATEIADEIQSLDPPSTIFQATGYNFPDALSAVPAAIKSDGVILLTRDNVQSSQTQAWINDHDTLTRYTIGGNLVAGGADPMAINISGQDLYATSAAVGTAFFPDPGEIGIATGTNFPDALSGGVFMATGGRLGPMLLVRPTGSLPPAIDAYLGTLDPATFAYVFGGPLAVSNTVVSAVVAAIGT